jgi:hypothetical protein
MRRLSFWYLTMLGLGAPCSLATLACSEKPKATVARPYALSSLNLPNDGKSAGRIEFTSPHASGSIEIAPEVRVEYELDVLGGPASSQKTILRIAQGELHFDGSELRIGERAFGALDGQVAIRIGRDGVFVNGEKRGDLGSSSR